MPQTSFICRRHNLPHQNQMFARLFQLKKFLQTNSIDDQHCKAFSKITTLSDRCICFAHLTNTFPLDDARPTTIPQEYIQPIEVALLEKIRRIKFNHKLYNLVQNTNYEFSATTEEIIIIRGLELLWPLLRTKIVLRMLAKLLVTSATIKTNFPNGLFPEPDSLYIEIFLLSLKQINKKHIISTRVFHIFLDFIGHLSKGWY